MDVERASADRGDEDARQRGECSAQGPGESRQPFGPAAVELEERRVVDHGSHGDAGSSTREQEADADCNEHTAAQGNRLVVGDVDTEELELCRVAEEELVGARHARVPDPLRQRDQAQHDADGDHDLCNVSRLAEPPHDDDVEDDAEEGGKDDEHHKEREGRGPVPAVSELPVGKCGQHRHGALGEVEDARGRVGEDET